MFSPCPSVILPARAAPRLLRPLLLTVLLLTLTSTVCAEKLLRVAADPNNLPFSNERGEGFENKIAELLARELDAKLEYT
jgi:mxaJ protein